MIRKVQEWARECGFSVAYSYDAACPPVFQTRGLNVLLTCHQRVIVLRKYPTGIAIKSRPCKAKSRDGLCLLCSLGYGMPTEVYEPRKTTRRRF